MPYTINRYNGLKIAVVADGTIDNTTDLKVIGKNYAGYGEVQNENFIFLLENFANTTPPPRPLSGQLWFDSGTNKLKFYDGGKFRTTGGAEVGAIAPSGLTTGDFWWDSVNKQLYAWDGSSFQLIGPQGVAGQGTTQMRSRSVKDTSGATHAIIEAVTNNNTSFIASKDEEFELDSTANSIPGFTKVKQGITLAYTNNFTDPNKLGVTQTNYRFWGTASSAEGLIDTNGRIRKASAFIQDDNPVFVSVPQFSDQGIKIGSDKFQIFVSGGTTPRIYNTIGTTIEFLTTITGSSQAVRTPIKLVGNDLLPGSDAASSTPTDIGTTTSKFRNVYATSFIGTADQANKLQVGTEYRSSSSSATSGTIAVRTSSDENINGVNILAGALKATYFVGTATSANYADLAEKYLADTDYETGTVVMIGGEKEVTAAQVGFRAIGAVSANPGYMMNSELEGGTFIALKGRVPVKVVGNVLKGQRLVAGPNGTAQAAMGNNSDVFAISLESNDETGIKLVECLIL